MNEISSSCNFDERAIKSWLDSGFVEAAFSQVVSYLKCKKERNEDIKEECNIIVETYRRSADMHTERRDWFSCGQILFDAGRLNILCEKFSDAANYFIDSAESFSNSARLYRQAASAYIIGVAILSEIEEKKIDALDHSEKARLRLKWELERYKLARDYEQLAQTYDDMFLLELVLGDYEEAIDNLENAAKAYSKLNDKHFSIIAGVRYSLIASIYKHILEKVGWSKFNKLAYDSFINGGDPVAASLELIKINLYISDDETALRDLLEAANKIRESASISAATSLLLSTFTIIHKNKNNKLIDELFPLMIETLKLNNDVKFEEIFKIFYTTKYNKPLEIDYLGRYKRTGGGFARIW